ncbi:phosphotransferase [[Mycoplasma] testudinis]|uniref:phosphotransferase n=1 Tax=[Mycoplasma] testudinis TaxID=33924 RepID=UPI000487DF7C|nr:phosphotransferase [[Mycoplasma] testudinis]
MSTITNQIKQLFETKMPESENRVTRMEVINEGFTNTSYFVVNQQNQKFQVRIGNIQINRNNESLFLKAMDNYGGFVYYDDKTGNAIKKWVEGRIPTITECRSEKFIKAFSKTLRNFQKLKVTQKMSKRDFYCFEKIADFKGIEKAWNKYRELIEKYKSLPLIASHNDLRPSNLIWDDKNVTFLDFEWGTRNHKYWDLCNFLREIEYPLKDLKRISETYFKTLDYEIIKEFLYATTCFAYQWTFFPELNEKLLAYRNNTKRLMLDYLKLIS